VDPGKIIFANMICAPEGLQVLARAYPQVKIVTASVDERLNDDKFIVPGLGDYGDRFFNTN
jgi:uracil phosphoribosyltransferase